MKSLTGAELPGRGVGGSRHLGFMVLGTSRASATRLCCSASQLGFVVTRTCFLLSDH